MIRYFVTHATAANLLMVASLILGAVALPNLQRDTFPVVPPTEVGVSIKYPGATPAEVETTICLPLEDALDSVAELIDIRCDARENRATATVEMREGADMDAFFNDVTASVEAISTFPARAERPSIEKLERVAGVASIAITGEMTPGHLLSYAENVRARLKQDRRIAQVQIKGFSDRQIQIEIPRDTARRFNLTLGDIATAVRRQSVDLPAGTLESLDGDLVVRFADERRIPVEFEDLLVKSGKEGGQVRLGDIGDIQVVFENPEDKILFNGKRAALLDISKTVNQDALRVMAAIKEALERERQIAPKGVQLTISQDVTSNIEDRLRILFTNGVQGLALVFLMMWLFFGFRFSFWVAMGLPISFLGATFFMHATGLTINMMSMVALIVAIGLLMDDAIVISENVAARFQAGGVPQDAATQGVTQVMPGVLSSFLTTVMILAPISFMAGKIGGVLKAIPVILIVTLLVSLMEAFLILPSHLAHSLAHANRGNSSRLQSGFNRQFERLKTNLFGPLADWSLRWRYLVFGLAVLLVIASYATLPAGLLKFRAFPALESDVIQARILLPQGTQLKRTEAIVDRVMQALNRLDDDFSQRQRNGQRLVQNKSVLYGINVDAYESGPHVATVNADLLRAEQRVGTIDEMLNRWRTMVGDVPDVLGLKFTDLERGVAGRDIDIRLHGQALDVLKKAAFELQSWLASFRGVLDLSDDLRPGKAELRLSLSDSALLSDVTAQQIAEEVRTALLGHTGLSVQVGRESHDIVVRLAGEDRRVLTDLEDITIRGPSGQLIPLGAVGRIEETRGFARIHRVYGMRTVTVQGKLDTTIANARDLMQITKKKFIPQLKTRYPQIRLSFVGQGREAAKTGSSLQRNLLVGLIGIFILLAFQFRSYMEPIPVIIAIPLGFIGVVLGHLMLGYELSMPSLVGLATLAGVVVNDSILLVTFIKEGRAQGMSTESAAAAAARERFRAVVLTSLTTVVGLLPLLLETSTQAQFLIPLIISIAFGLFVATFLSLFIVPVAYTILSDFRLIKDPEFADF